jgi:hypothetical protein
VIDVELFIAGGKLCPSLLVSKVRTDPFAFLRAEKEGAGKVVNL